MQMFYHSSALIDTKGASPTSSGGKASTPPCRCHSTSVPQAVTVTQPELISQCWAPKPWNNPGG